MDIDCKKIIFCLDIFFADFVFFFSQIQQISLREICIVFPSRKKHQNVIEGAIWLSFSFKLMKSVQKNLTSL